MIFEGVHEVFLGYVLNVCVCVLGDVFGVGDILRFVGLP